MNTPVAFEAIGMAYGNEDLHRIAELLQGHGITAGAEGNLTVGYEIVVPRGEGRDSLGIVDIASAPSGSIRFFPFAPAEFVAGLRERHADYMTWCGLCDNARQAGLG
jgi:hypothetical protein